MESILRKEIIISKAIIKPVLSLLFVLAITLGAFIRIPLPFTPVPLTLQTFFVLLSAAFLGLRWGIFTQLAYLFLGFAGVSVFTGTGTGLIYLAGPTAGYLFGFTLATVFIAGSIEYAKGSFLKAAAVFFCASFLILSCGTAWLKIVFQLTWLKASVLGFLPFLLGDSLKAILAALLFMKLKGRVKSAL
jgi:biotin transport system substrate-specific component